MKRLITISTFFILTLEAKPLVKNVDALISPSFDFNIREKKQTCEMCFNKEIIKVPKKVQSLPKKSSKPLNVKVYLGNYQKQLKRLGVQDTKVASLPSLPKFPSIHNEEIEELARKHLGKPYVWGGVTPKGFDCSGFTKYVFNKVGYVLPRTALQQSKKGIDISTDDFKKGDLLYFNTDKSRGIPVSHVGIYLEDGKFIHAANKKKGIIISDFKSYSNTFVKAKRVLKTPKNMVIAKIDSDVNPLPPLLSIPKDTPKKVSSFMTSYDPFIIYKGRYIRQSQLPQRKE